MDLEIITLDRATQWDETVHSFKNYDVNYLSGYAKAFQLHGDGVPILFYYNAGSTRAINVVMKRDIAKDIHFIGKIEEGIYYDFSTPYGYGGFQIEGSDTVKVNESYDQYCRENHIICEFIRFNLFNNYTSNYNGYAETRTHSVVRSLDMDPETMLTDFEHKVRTNLKKAIRSNLMIKIDNGETDIEIFLNVYYSTMNRKEANESYYFSKEFFDTINLMKNNVVYFHVLYEDKVIASELVLYDKKNCYSYLGGTLREYFDLRPNEFLKYELFKWAYNKGFKNIVLGGGYGSDDGIYHYKKSLAPNGIVDFYIGRKIFIKDTYEKLVKMRTADLNFNENITFFPLYRG